ncbi:hypothetical protein GCM10027059_48350 [Myceligenerans halotolerans]
MNTGFNVTSPHGPDQTDPRKIDWALRMVRAVVPFKLTPAGLPLHPLADQLRDLKPGRGGLWHWGEAVASDAIVTATDRHGTRRLLMVERADEHGWALPGGMLDPGETPVAACVRELAEETGLLIDAPDLTMLPGRLVPDPRQGLNAWIATVPGVIHLDTTATTTGLPAVTGLDDAADAAWLPARNYAALLYGLAVRGGELFPAHRDLLRDVLN